MENGESGKKRRTVGEGHRQGVHSAFPARLHIANTSAWIHQFQKSMGKTEGTKAKNTRYVLLPRHTYLPDPHVLRPVVLLLRSRPESLRSLGRSRSAEKNENREPGWRKPHVGMVLPPRFVLCRHTTLTDPRHARGMERGGRGGWRGRRLEEGRGQCARMKAVESVGGRAE